MLRRLNIRSKLLVTVALPLLLLLGVGAVALPTFQTVKVNGPAYQKIKDLQNLRADVLPPPEMLLEAHLLSASMLMQLGDAMTDAGLQDARDQMAALEARYRVQHDYWSQKLSDGELQKALLTDSFTPADAYFQTFDKEFFPLLQRAMTAGYSASSKPGDPAYKAFTDAQNVFRKKLDPLFTDHRTAVDQVVARTDALLKKTESDTSGLISRRLALLVAITLLALVAAGVVGTAVARAISGPVKRLTDAANSTAREELPRVVAEVQEGNDAVIVPVPVEGTDELGQLAEAFNAMQSTAVSLAAEQARVRKNVAENLVNLGRRNQVLLGRTLSFVTQLEESERDPKRLDELFRLDHLTTRMRRNAESLLVLAGAEPPRMWSEPVDIGDVVRAALSEIEDYRRVELTGMEPAKMQGAVVGDVAHLLAELLENATSFSAPTSKVSVLGKRRSDGYLIVIVDEGFGMTREELDQCNRRLSEPASFDSHPTKVLGLHVVGKLAQRHGIRAELTESFSVGTAARILLPDSLFDTGAPGARGAAPALVSSPALGTGPASGAPSRPERTAHPAPPTVPTGDEFDALFNVPFGAQSFQPLTTGPEEAPIVAAPTVAPATRDGATVASATSAVAPTAVETPARPLPQRTPTAAAEPGPLAAAAAEAPSLPARPAPPTPPVTPVGLPSPFAALAEAPTVQAPTPAWDDTPASEPRGFAGFGGFGATPSAPESATPAATPPAPPAAGVVPPFTNELFGPAPEPDPWTLPAPPAFGSGRDSGRDESPAATTPEDDDDWLSDMAIASVTGPLLGAPDAAPKDLDIPADIPALAGWGPEPSGATETGAPALSAADLGALDRAAVDPAAGGPAAPATGGLRRRVPGAQLPDTGPAPSEALEDQRDPGAVRTVLGGLQRGVEGARRAAEDPAAG